MPIEVIRALALIKKAAALVNAELGVLPVGHGAAHRPGGRRGHRGPLDDQFPLRVWQTGSGTQTNMNVNEVIANRAIELAGGARGEQAADPSQRRRESLAVLERRLSGRDVDRRGHSRSERDLIPAVQRVHDAIDGQGARSSPAW